MVRVVLLTGGNVGDVTRRLAEARRLIGSRIGTVACTSRLHTSAPWGFDAEQPFGNQVVVAETDLAPREVLREIQTIECELGRDRAAEQAEKEATGARYVSRPIDIDILFYGEAVIDEPDLTVPHPRLPEREFVLTPLCEVMGDWRHPQLGMTMCELRDKLLSETMQ